MLLERAGEVVGREELQKKLWPADTFVDFDHGLNKAINKIREALSDSAESPRFRRKPLLVAATASSLRSESPMRHLLAVRNPNLSLIRGRSSDRRNLAGTLATAQPSSPVTCVDDYRRPSLLVLLMVLSPPGSFTPGHPPVTRSFAPLAVLPLESLSSDASQDYFADGMTDELISRTSARSARCA